jgi:ATP-dependent DNA ligase
VIRAAGGAVATTTGAPHIHGMGDATSGEARQGALPALPFTPPLPPMLARLARELPRGDFLYEPKWDGFRCLAFATGGQVVLQSRNERPLTRYFPELIEALAALRRSLVIDGEILPDGGDFSALLNRIHPASSRVEQLRAATPARLVAFDLLALDGEDLRQHPFGQRRRALEAVLADPPPGLALTPATEDLAAAQGWLEARGAGGIDGVVAKLRSAGYQPGKRALIKIKAEHTVDCVVAGFRSADAAEPAVASLLLGLYDEGQLRHVGVSSHFTAARRRELAATLEPLVVPLPGHPWERGFGIGHSPVGRLPGSAGRWDPAEMEQDWVALRPELVCEVGYDQLDGWRFRHPALFKRWRPDRDPLSCLIEQLAPPARSGS